MEKPKTLWFIKTLTKSQILDVLHQNFNVSVDEDLSVDQLRELLQTKISAATSPQFVSEPQQVDSTSGEDTPVIVNEELSSEKPENSTEKVKRVSKRNMGDSKIEFRLKDDKWDTFVERMELYFEANDTPPEKWVPEILTKVSVDAYELIRNLATPKKPKDLTFDELNNLVSEHLDPKPTEMVERHKFSNARQYPNESVSDFVARLKKLSLNCNFTDVEVQLRDRFVSGIKAQDTQTELLLQKDLTLQSAVEIAKTREQASASSASFSRGRGRGRGGPHYHHGGGSGGHQSNSGYQQKQVSNPAQPTHVIVHNVIGHSTQNRGGGLKIHNRGNNTHKSNVTHKKPGGNPPNQQHSNNSGDKPKGNQPKNDKPKGDKPKGDQPKNDKPKGDKPKGDKPKGDKPKGDKPKPQKSEAQ